MAERIVGLGRDVDGWVEVRGGLEERDEVATDHLDTLSDGSAVSAASP